MADILLFCFLNISIHASHAGCDKSALDLRHLDLISIHASHAGCDDGYWINTPVPYISIHASHAGCDLIACCHCSGILRYFNPRIPCGMRPGLSIAATNLKDFNPRIPCGMRRVGDQYLSNVVYFNPRIPCGMRLDWIGLAVVQSFYFNPRIPCGMRRHYFNISNSFQHFNFQHFNPRIPCGMRREGQKVFGGKVSISIHASHAGCDMRSIGRTISL